MSRRDQAMFGCVGVIVTLVAVAVLVPIWSGLVLGQLWAWFIVPMFHLPQIGVPEAIGLSLLVGFLTKDLTVNRESDKDKEWWEPALIAFLYPTITLVMAWVVHMFLVVPT